MTLFKAVLSFYRQVLHGTNLPIPFQAGVSEEVSTITLLLSCSTEGPSRTLQDSKKIALEQWWLDGRLPSRPNWLQKDITFGVKFPGPFLAGKCAESPYCGCQFEGRAVRISTENEGNIAENRTSTDVHRRYFGVDGRFSAVDRS